MLIGNAAVLVDLNCRIDDKSYVHVTHRPYKEH